MVSRGHRVIIESNAGLGIGENDASYQAAGGEIFINASDVWSEAKLVVKVFGQSFPLKTSVVFNLFHSKRV